MSDKFLHSFLKSNIHLLKKNSSLSPAPSIFPIQLTPLFNTSIQSTLPLFIHKSDNTQELLRLKFHEILLHIVESDVNGAFLTFLEDIFSHRIKDLKGIMEENFTKPLNVEEFARLSGRSLSTFKKEFSQVFNLSPKKWINRKRLERAHFLLSRNEKNVSEICFEVGFENNSYFSQLFKQHFGETPRQVQHSKKKKDLTNS